MEFDNSIDEPDDDDEEFPPLPSDIDLPSYTNTIDPYDNRSNTIDFYYCSSPPLPSPPPPPPPPPPPSLPSSTSSATLARIYANARTFSSIRNHDSMNQLTIAFATQQKKKTRAPIACPFQSVYVNIPVSPSLPPPPSPFPLSIDISNEVTYATLMNTTSLMPSVYSDIMANHVEYQQIQIQNEVDKINHPRIYENIKSRRPPPPPCDLQIDTLQRSSSFTVIPVDVDVSLTLSKINNNDIIPSSSEHLYINLQHHEDKPPDIPTRTCKPILITAQISPPPPPIIPRRNEQQKEDMRCASSSITPSPVEREPHDEDLNVLDTSSNASTVRTVKELEIKISPSCDNKNKVYRTKTSVTTVENVPSFINARQRRALHGVRRRRLRGSVALRSSTRGSINTTINRPQHQRSNLNVTVRHPMVTDDRWRRTLRKRRRQHAIQMKLDGNVLHQRMKSIRPTSDHTYNEIKQPILSNNSIRTNGHNGAAGGVLERAMQFNGALRDRVFSWYRGANHNDREQQQQQQQQQEQQQTTSPPQVFSTSENGESDQRDTATNEDEEEQEEQEEQEFFTHDTFEDFLLRRRPKSSASTTTSGTSTVVSHIDSVSQRISARTAPKQKHHVPRPPPPPPPPAPPPLLAPTPPPARRFPGLALSLDKTDVDFIHNILQRTRGDHRVWNRITALKEAYIRATSKTKNLPKKPKPIQTQMDEKKKKKTIAMQHSLAATKIRAELEKYDELPASRGTVIDDDDYDETCSANDHHKINYNVHHRSVSMLPPTPSATHRIINFVTSIKRRAQNNVQQLQKNLHDIRSRVHVESMAIPPNHIGIQRHSSTTTVRQRPTIKESTNTPRAHLSRVETTPDQTSLVRRTNSHRSATSTEHINTFHRHQLNRTQSNASQLPQQRHTQRQQHHITNEKSAIVVDRSASLATRPPPFERHSSRPTQNGVTPRQQRSKKTS